MRFLKQISETLKQLNLAKTIISLLIFFILIYLFVFSKIIIELKIIILLLYLFYIRLGITIKEQEDNIINAINVSINNLIEALNRNVNKK